MQRLKIRRACCVPVTRRNGVNGRTVILESPVRATYQSIQLNVKRNSSQNGLAR